MMRPRVSLSITISRGKGKAMSSKLDNLANIEAAVDQAKATIAALRAENAQLKAEAISPEQLATLDRIAAKVANLVPPNPPGA